MRPTELQILLDLSSAIASVRSKDELFRVILDKINPVFDCSRHAVVITIDPNEEYFDLMLSSVSDFPAEEISFLKSLRSPIGPPLRAILDSQEPIIFQTEELIKKYPEEIGAQFNKKLGIKEIIACRLQVSGKTIGVFSLHADKLNHFNKQQIPLFKAVAEQLAVAVSNILSGEEAKLKEEEKSRLLNISRSIANVRDKNDLFHLITKDLKSFIPFDVSVISLLNEESNSFGIFLADVVDEVRSREGFEQARTQVYPIAKGSVPYRVIRSADPLVVDIEKEYLNNPEIPYLKNAHHLGLQEQLLTRLVHSGKVIGALSLASLRHNTYTPKEIQTLKSISNLFAIALNNILSNQALEEREQQKAQLLKISAHIATIKEKGDLFHLIANEVRSFIAFDDLFIASVDMDKQTFGVFLSDPGETTKDHENYTKAISYVYPLVKGTIPYKISVSEKPFVFDVETEYRKDPSDYLKFAHEFGMKEVLVARLVNSGKVIGLLGMLSKVRRYGQADINTLQSLSSMLAIALYNILANEQIRSRDYQKSQLLKISEYIAHIRNKKDLFHLFTQELKSFISFDDAVLFIVNEEKRTFRVVLSDPSSTSGTHPEYITAVTKSFSFEKGSLPDLVIRSDKPLIFDIKKEHFKHPEIEYLRHPYNFGMKDELFTRLVYSGKVIGMFAILSKETGKYSDADVETLQSLSSLIAIALNNILANEEIENLSKQLAQENLYLSEEIKSNYNFEEIVGESHALKEVFRKAMQVADADSTVLLLGETGTGKELVARAIHNLSSRKARPLIKINCAALPAQLIESELFGHERGSFTGATDRRTGKFELAGGSSIFLDEIGELPLELQSKLLRVLQEKEIERIGGDKTIKVDVRIIAATNRNLEKEVAAGKFRQDLYYRLNIYPVELPPLRERKEDIPLLAMHFIAKFSKKLGKKITGMSPEALEELKTNTWPGNVRELEHTIERSMLLCSGKTINSFNISKPVILVPNNPVVNIFQPQSLADNERDLILRTLKYTSGRVRGKDGAAELLNILPTTLEARMKKLGIRKEFVKE